jgi:glycerol-3-phosphate dehydrogenase (NAD(P)+)
MKIGIMGAGSWGLTLAWLWAKPGADTAKADVWLWDRKPEKIESIRENRNRTFPLPVDLPESVVLTTDVSSELADTDIVVLAVTAEGTRAACQLLQNAGISTTTVVVNTSKGIELASLKRLSQVIKEELPRNRQAVLSGPTLAKEVLKGLPTAASIASEDLDLAEHLQTCLSRDYHLRLYSNPDVTGVELGGALKNIFAISSGYIAGKDLGDNARAALLTRGLAEMTSFSLRLGAQEMTLYGLSGLGDLLATSNSPLSRNFQVGYMLAQGKKLSEVLEEIKVVAEGVQAAQAVKLLAEKLDVDVPIVQEINRALFESPSEAFLIKSLMSRKLTSEKIIGSNFAQDRI